MVLDDKVDLDGCFIDGLPIDGTPSVAASDFFEIRLFRAMSDCTYSLSSYM